MNAELDATLGPILQVHARAHGVILSACDGDQPGVEINLYRFVKGLGLIPRVMGNIKGLQDPYRTPTTQKAFAEKWGQNPSMVTSFADGSKVSFEQAIVANATGMIVAKRGHARVRAPRARRRADEEVRPGHAARARRHRRLRGRRPAGARRVLPRGTRRSAAAALSQSVQARRGSALQLLHARITSVTSRCPNTIARVALFGDAAAQPIGGPLVEVCAVAKRDLAAGEVLDDYGHYMTYGEAVNSPEMRRGRYLPEGLVEGCRLTRPHRKGRRHHLRRRRASGGPARRSAARRAGCRVCREPRGATDTRRLMARVSDREAPRLAVTTAATASIETLTNTSVIRSQICNETAEVSGPADNRKKPVISKLLASGITVAM